MERKVPDVFDVFGIGKHVNLSQFIFLKQFDMKCTVRSLNIVSFSGQPYVPSQPKGGIALPGLVAKRDDGSGYVWSQRLSAQNDKWREGRTQCERPRTYDKFYQKTPGNFQALVRH